MKMRSCILLLAGMRLMEMGSAKITLDTVRNLTVVTRECRGLVEGVGLGVGVVGDGGEMGLRVKGVRGGNGQVVLSGSGSAVREGGEEDEKGEVEDTITAALRILCSDMLWELNKPVGDEVEVESQIVGLVQLTSTTATANTEDCKRVKAEFSDFLGETTRFLYAIQERQMRFQWRVGSQIQVELGWLQGLWASRKGNTQNLSFIEQQMQMYKKTECFDPKRINQEVLRRDVEIVEYLNDLRDLFV